MKKLLLFLIAVFNFIGAFAQAPTITSFTPASGPVGTLVTVTGTNLGTPTAFTIGDVAAITISNTGTHMVGMVMPGATAGKAMITTAYGSASSAGNFTVTDVSYTTATQQGVKTVGTGAVDGADQASSVAVSADGNTVIEGGPVDNSNMGGVWIFTKNGSTWAQQGNKMVGSGVVGIANFGTSVAISADGNTAIVGGNSDNSYVGAAWVFTRNNGTWTQQGAKLVGSDVSGAARQGLSVSISADGNTAIVGGMYDDNGAGAVWVYTRNNGVWTQQGPKLVGTGAVGASNQGSSVFLSSDGNTLICGGNDDNAGVGAAWVFTRNGNSWVQQGTKLLGKDATLAASQGQSVCLSANGNTAAIGGTTDNNGIGAAWIFTRSGNTWTQQGAKLVGIGAKGNAYQGGSVALSADGNILLMGGSTDNFDVGATWLYARQSSVWTQLGPKLAAPDAVDNNRQGYSVSLSSDASTFIIGGPNDNSGVGAFWTYAPSSVPITPVPVINTISPISGSPGTLVTVTGANLDNHTSFTIGGTTALTITGTSTQLVGMVMPGATTGKVSITTGGGTGNSQGNFTVTATPYPIAIQGPTLIGTGAVDPAAQGTAVSVSADESTAIIGASGDNSSHGTAWIFTRNDGAWTQQGGKLTGSGAVGAASQGGSVAISADGNTAIVGGPNDNSNQGAVWIYTRTGGAWEQQGAKLTGMGSAAMSTFGSSVSLSADGNTAIVGGNGDNGGQGAFWVFTRSGGSWIQQGSKMMGTAAVGPAQQGASVSLSADGNTAIVGGGLDNSSVGAVWIFIRSGTTWSQQGGKLVAYDTSGPAQQGGAVSISADGNTAIIGGSFDNVDTGAAWIYTRSDGIWRQQGTKLSANDGAGLSARGFSVCLSADGNTAIVGGNTDNYARGAVWRYTRRGGVWAQQGAKLTSGDLELALFGNSISLSADGITALVGGPTYNSNQGASWIFGPALSTDATLIALSGTGLTLNPLFTSTTKTYTTSVSYSISTITITPVTNSTTATVKVNGTVVASGSASTPITLNAGPDTVNVVVTAQDGITTQTYSVIIKRASAATITSINRTAAAAGMIVTITGTNFTETTAVSFGGVPAASFFVASATTINAIVGTGASGNVSVTTPLNEADFAGFTFIPVPTISAAGPTTIMTGGSVVLNANPQTGFSYQWFRGDSTAAISGATTSSYKATVSGNYRVSISLNSVSQVSAPITVTTVFELPADNFQISVTGATCEGSSNGSISIAATQSFNYTATITGNSLNKPYPFTDSVQINNLAAGTYNLCMTVAGQPDFQQCFTVVISQPKDLSAYTAVAPSGDQVVVNLAGGDTYKLVLNGILYMTSGNQITLPLAKGINTITISSDKPCQGVLVKNVNVSPKILVYPNPFNNNINLSLGDDNLKTALISVISAEDGRPVYTNIYNNVAGIMQIDLSGVKSGLYLLRISGDNLEKVFKIQKR